MLVTAIPREDINSVSTRLNYYYYLSHLPEGIHWKKHKKDFGDVLYIQKKADDATVKIAKKAKKLGVPIVYNCDDNPYEKPGKRRVTMLKLASAATCDTDARAEQLKKASGIRNVVVIPECIDYWDRIKRVEIRKEMKLLTTFGNNANAINSAKYMKFSTISCCHINSKKIDGAGKFIKWKLDTFVDEFIKADVCLLAHGDNIKSNLKLLVSMYMGMPTIVSNTDAYAETLRSIGLDYLIAVFPHDTEGILSTIKPFEVRRQIQDAFLRYDYSRHTPENSGKLLGRVLKHVSSRTIC